ncbi:glucose-6-phosphate dehydrogenase, partial [Candidatus Margulisiibacteriota bacterium]
LIIDIQPDEKIYLKFGAKRPGAKVVLDEVSMDFDYKSSFSEQRISAYHQLIMDIITGDQIRYIRKDGIEKCWEIVDNIRSYSKEIDPELYEIGSNGPASLA